MHVYAKSRRQVVLLPGRSRGATLVDLNSQGPLGRFKADGGYCLSLGELGVGGKGVGNAGRPISCIWSLL
jgi:hypothetical protein